MRCTGHSRTLPRKQHPPQSTRMLLLEAAPHHQGLDLSLPGPGCIEGQILSAALDEALPLHTLLSTTTKSRHLLGTSLSTHTAFPDTQTTSPMQPCLKYISWHKIWHCCPCQHLWMEKENPGNPAEQYGSKTDVSEITKHKKIMLNFKSC